MDLSGTRYMLQHLGMILQHPFVVDISLNLPVCADGSWWWQLFLLDILPKLHLVHCQIWKGIAPARGLFLAVPGLRQLSSGWEKHVLEMLPSSFTRQAKRRCYRRTHILLLGQDRQAIGFALLVPKRKQDCIDVVVIDIASLVCSQLMCFYGKCTWASWRYLSCKVEAHSQDMLQPWLPCIWVTESWGRMGTPHIWLHIWAEIPCTEGTKLSWLSCRKPETWGRSMVMTVGNTQDKEWV